MIPTIETIIEELLKGDITKQKAITWLNQHAADAHSDLRDHFAGLAMPEVYGRVESGGFERVAKLSYELADAMLEERLK